MFLRNKRSLIRLIIIVLLAGAAYQQMWASKSDTENTSPTEEGEIYDHNNPRNNPLHLEEPRLEQGTVSEPGKHILMLEEGKAQRLVFIEDSTFQTSIPWENKWEEGETKELVKEAEHQSGLDIDYYVRYDADVLERLSDKVTQSEELTAWFADAGFPMDGQNLETLDVQQVVSGVQGVSLPTMKLLFELWSEFQGSVETDLTVTSLMSWTNGKRS
ncbi:hypothetical protein N781_01725 [Pontibacillus halophilus JSM 076056 = DSM 19796]|uniref:Regulatory protein YycH-like domain-containing protein n=1 Tax=Pontibacillus halophilus JSM 076056 = DSM 19796 TaxID=1385510 RepID=A0A0A5GLE0_9BACI|nr:hypothetical protein [Pontibacillus halophilus]KGX94091.1 hypothetical protein N781_01725 [Pontibacillus halophilus JSM 076056 = DSM 19796]